MKNIYYAVGLFVLLAAFYGALGTNFLEHTRPQAETSNLSQHYDYEQRVCLLPNQSIEKTCYNQKILNHSGS